MCYSIHFFGRGKVLIPFHTGKRYVEGMGKRVENFVHKK